MVKSFITECTELYCHDGEEAVCQMLDDLAEICKLKYAVVVHNYGCGTSFTCINTTQTAYIKTGYTISKGVNIISPLWN